MSLSCGASGWTGQQLLHVTHSLFFVFWEPGNSIASLFPASRPVHHHEGVASRMQNTKQITRQICHDAICFSCMQAGCKPSSVECHHTTKVTLVAGSELLVTACLPAITPYKHMLIYNAVSCGVWGGIACVGMHGFAQRWGILRA